MTNKLPISTKNCTVEKDDRTLIVTLNRPEAKNAFSPEMLLGMYKSWRLLDEDDDLMCAILTANGDTFCAGMDLKAAEEGHRSTEEFMELMATVPNIHWQALLRDDRPNSRWYRDSRGYRSSHRRRRRDLRRHRSGSRSLSDGRLQRSPAAPDSLLSRR
jgi:enoyl-CoA hydratase